jgi:HJR/Mrr/RecB family endonuclease
MSGAMQTVSCPSCRHMASVPEFAIGKNVSCAACRVVFVAEVAFANVLPAGVVAATVPIVSKPIPLATPVLSAGRNPEFRSVVPDDAVERVVEFRREVQELEAEAARIRADLQNSNGRLATASLSWEQQGKPQVGAAEVEQASQTADQVRSVFDSLRKERDRILGRVRRLRFTKAVRDFGESNSLPWWGMALLAATVVLAIFTFFSLPFARSGFVVFWFAVLGFIIGLVASSVFLLRPADEALSAEITRSEHDLSERTAKLKAAEVQLQERTAIYDRLRQGFESLQELQQAAAEQRQLQTDANQINLKLAQANAALAEMERSCGQKARLLNSNWRDLTDRDFERFVAAIFKELGFSVELIGGSGDQGIDVIAVSERGRFAVQAKGYPNSTVSNGAVQQAFAGMKFHRCVKCIAITNSRFTPSARELAESVKCTLIDAEAMEDLIYGRISL